MNFCVFGLVNFCFILLRGFSWARLLIMISASVQYSCRKLWWTDELNEMRTNYPKKNMIFKCFFFGDIFYVIFMEGRLTKGPYLCSCCVFTFSSNGAKYAGKHLGYLQIWWLFWFLPCLEETFWANERIPDEFWCWKTESLASFQPKLTVYWSVRLRRVPKCEG